MRRSSRWQRILSAAFRSARSVVVVACACGAAGCASDRGTYRPSQTPYKGDAVWNISRDESGIPSEDDASVFPNRAAASMPRPPTTLA